ncbi:type III-B CRISPR module-associated protein Cmr5 [Methylocaldum sp. 14B]|jgi:CRISPR-associated protein Cmr5|uniref:type III-B CRISPR module-associated protein Cmr5 n=1 Tax=unclassified Methylocaldum TaxID=2622260 RepID=UPI00098B31F3|nr:type III-B CRISPR module-associated protein Cmr5 [Methylocaldum sp. 14B]
MPVQTIEQQRAAFALEWATGANPGQCGGRISMELKSAAESFPSLILKNGLGQAAAFYKSKDDNHKKLYKLLSDWLTGPGQAYAGQDDLLVGITRGAQYTYRAAQAEALAFLLWVKKFVKAYGEN